MREKTVKRYYCDYCSKGMFKKPSMVEHEITCCANPHRKCYLCKDAYAPDMKTIIPLFREKCIDISEWDEESEFKNADAAAIKWLMSQCGQCPACVLAVLKQSKVYAFDVFNYKKELDIWWKEQNEEMRELVGW